MARLITVNSVFIKQTLLVIVVISLLYILSIGINDFACQDVKNRTIETTASKIDYYVRNMEYEVSQVIAEQKRLFVDRDLIQLSSGKVEIGEYQRKKVIDEMRVKLLRISEICKLIEDVYVYIPIQNKKISSTRVSELNSEDNAMINEALNTQGNFYPFTQIGETICINLISVNVELSSYDKNYPQFMIQIEFSRDLLKSELSRIFEDEESATMLVAPNFYVSSNDNPIESIEKAIVEIARDNKQEDVVEYVEEVISGKDKYVLFHKRPKMLNVSIATYIPNKYFFHAMNVYWLWFCVVTACTLITTVWVLIKLYKMIALPINNLVKAFDEMKDGNFNARVEYSKNDEISKVYEGFNQMFSKIRQLIQSNYEQKIYVQSAQLKQLQYHINPHFLYNTLFIIYRMAKMNDCDSVVRLAEYLGKYYQYITKNTLDMVPLSEEVAHALYYTEIQTIRFSEMVSFEFDPIPKICHSILVPKLMLQPVIENAFVHGLEKKAEGGRLLVKHHIDEDVLIITVEDNGTAVKDDTLSELRKRLDSNRMDIEISGLINVHRRLRINFGDEFGAFVSVGKMGGLKVTLKIPMSKERNKHV